MFLTPKSRWLTAIACIVFITTAGSATEEDEVLAIANLALDRITAEDPVGLSDLMIEQAMIVIGIVEDGVYSVRTRTYEETRNNPMDADIVERGWDPTVMVSGTIAVVWYPYDIYVDSKWSHCGVDVFNLVRTNDGWRIAMLQFNVQQPPECEKHPDGPPKF